MFSISTMTTGRNHDPVFSMDGTGVGDDNTIVVVCEKSQKLEDRCERVIDLGIATGSLSGTYSAIAENINAIVKNDCIRLTPKTTAGAVENALDIHADKCCQLGIVQHDIWHKLKELGDNEIITPPPLDRLRVLKPLHQEVFHVITRKSITNIHELNGKNIYAGKELSGTYYTAKILLGGVIENLEPHNLGIEEAVQGLINGRFHAVVFVAGTPVKEFKHLDEDNYHLLPVPLPTNLKDDYSIVEVESSSKGPYSWVTDSVETVAVRAYLITYDWHENLSKSKFTDHCIGVNKVEERIDWASRYLSGSEVYKDEISYPVPRTTKTTIHPAWRTVDIALQYEKWEEFRSGDCE